MGTKKLKIGQKAKSLLGLSLNALALLMLLSAQVFIWAPTI